MEARTQYYQVADLLIDAEHARVWRDGCEILLGKLTFDLLIALVRAAPELVSVDTLISVVWAGTVVGPETVSQRVKRLRVALSDDPKAPRYVGGVRGRGYRLVATVKSRAAMEVAPPPSRRALHWRAALAGATALILLLAGSYGWVRLSPRATAAQLYLQAGSVALSEPGLRKAMLLLDGAIARQPDFAPAFAARAEVRVGIGLLGYAPPDVLEGAERDAHRALALQPGLKTANAVLGITDSYRGNWLNAEAQFRTALAVADPGAAVRAEYATFCLGSAGHLQQALLELNRAYRLAPSSQSTVVLLAAMNALAGHEDAAYRLAVLARDLGYPQNSPPLVQILAGSAQRRGDFAQAARLAQASLSATIRSAGGAETLNIVYAALADPARRPAAHAALEHLLSSVDQSDLDIVTRVEIIEWLTQTNALDSAYALADATIDQFARSGAVGNTWGFLWGEEMRPFRQDARFQGLVQRLKLVSEWQRNGAPDNCSLKEQQLNCV